MDKDILLNCIQFFNKIKIVENDVTSELERNNGQHVVEVTYYFEGKSYTTNRLYYKNIDNINQIKNKSVVTNYFGSPVYWLDIEMHQWPQGSGESDLEEIVINDIAPEFNSEFKIFLNSIANNEQTGYIQIVTDDGRTGQYYHNLENNNHWHDLINLIKAIINNKGNEVDKKYFSRLVFRWDGDKNTNRERSTLTNRAYGCSRALIDWLYLNIKSIQNELNMENIIDLLKFKKQIILQGPPGTGKTRMAKEIAIEMTRPEKIDFGSIVDFSKKVTLGQIIGSQSENVIFTIKEFKEDKYLIQMANTHKEIEINYTDIVKAYELKSWRELSSSSEKTINLIAKFIYENIFNDEQFKIIQFHPSYTYEDFVRGIVVRTDISTTPEYKTVNKILGEFARKANVSNLSGGTDDFDRVWYDLIQDINDGNVKKIGTSDVNVDLNSEGNIRFKTPVATYEKTYELYKFGRTDLKYETYNRIVLKFLKDSNNKYQLKDYVSPKSISSNKPYVLVIDEINRANLPSVLGELIYALEYRGENVESIYATKDEGNTFILPPNLYIIGTMNTADRSVGHIDYAIRRRFAFVDVLPSSSTIDEVIKDAALNKKAKDLFEQVSLLFHEKENEQDQIPVYLQSDFKGKDVQLGHSYFLADDEATLNMKLEYEIKPLLLEYIKDGILSEDARQIISKL